MVHMVLPLLSCGDEQLNDALEEIVNHILEQLGLCYGILEFNVVEISVAVLYRACFVVADRHLPLVSMENVTINHNILLELSELLGVDYGRADQAQKIIRQSVGT